MSGLGKMPFLETCVAYLSSGVEPGGLLSEILAQRWIFQPSRLPTKPTHIRSRGSKKPKLKTRRSMIRHRHHEDKRSARGDDSSGPRTRPELYQHFGSVRRNGSADWARSMLGW